jgi:hypothetical protein
MASSLLTIGGPLRKLCLGFAYNPFRSLRSNGWSSLPYTKAALALFGGEGTGMKGNYTAVKLMSSAIFLAATGLGTAACYAADHSAPMPDMHWRMIGPFRGGRTRAAAGVPDQPNVFYVGQVDGGVWKSTDYGRTWNPIFDGQDTQSIGAIAVAPSDSNVIYVASG